MPAIEEIPDDCENVAHADSSEGASDSVSSTRRPGEDGIESNRAESGGVASVQGEESASQEAQIITDVDRLIREEQLDKARRLKAEGNQLFGEHNYVAAASKYTEALEAAPEGDKENAVYLNNRATCFFKLGDYERVIQDCSAALRIDPDYAKCLLRRAQVGSCCIHNDRPERMAVCRRSAANAAC
jgi:import receptor subunit TOM70